MKRYPSIPHRLPKKYRNLQVHVFDKVDGSNLRFDWDKKLGWHRWGSRTQLVDETHPVFGQAMAIFQETLADTLAQVAVDHKWSSMVAFAEFWGPGSLAGHHDPDTKKELTLFDVAPYKRGMIGPESFLDLFGDLNIPAYLGLHTWDDELLDAVLHETFEGISHEGVIGKVGSGHKLAMVKAKTNRWKDDILGKYGKLQGASLLAS